MAVGRDEPLLAARRAPTRAPLAVGRSTNWAFDNPHGQRVEGFTRRARTGRGRTPSLMYVHGGPTWLDLDRWDPWVQAYADAGFLVALVNYRGSVGYGREWRDTLIGNIGRPETEDVAGRPRRPRPARAGRSGPCRHRRLVVGRLHHPVRRRHRTPDRFVAGVAGVPVGDYVGRLRRPVAAPPGLRPRAAGRDAPAEVPELMADRSPITYVDDVRAPLLIIAGENDSRCPLRQVMNYVDRLRARGADHELYLFGTGHGSMVTDEKVRQAGLILDFLARRVPGVTRLPPPSTGLPETT